jgi:NTP pyrophosphatase (non-canonical NTP hydrolase)
MIQQPLIVKDAVFVTKIVTQINMTIGTRSILGLTINKEINMDIRKYIEEAHGIAKDKGFYDCPECGGSGTWIKDGKKLEGYSCPVCHGTGIDPNRNIGELLMFTMSELCEALVAHRCRRSAIESALVNIDDYPANDHQEEALYLFETYIKDTFEDEIADVFIYLFDICGYLGIEYESINTNPIVWKSENIAQRIRQMCKYLDNLDEDNLTNYDVIHGIHHVTQFADAYNIPIEKHIEAKMAYNRTRPRKHGKEY